MEQKNKLLVDLYLTKYYNMKDKICQLSFNKGDRQMPVVSDYKKVKEIYADAAKKLQKKRRFPGRCPEPRDVWSVGSKLMHKGNAFVRRPFKKG